MAGWTAAAANFLSRKSPAGTRGASRMGAGENLRLANTREKMCLTSPQTAQILTLL